MAREIDYLERTLLGTTAATWQGAGGRFAKGRESKADPVKIGAWAGIAVLTVLFWGGVIAAIVH